MKDIRSGGARWREDDRRLSSLAVRLPKLAAPFQFLVSLLAGWIHRLRRGSLHDPTHLARERDRAGPASGRGAAAPAGAKPELERLREFTSDLQNGTLPSVAWLVDQDQDSGHPDVVVPDLNIPVGGVYSGEGWTVKYMNQLMQSPYWGRGRGRTSPRLSRLRLRPHRLPCRGPAAAWTLRRVDP